MFEKVKKIFKINHKVVKDEITEITQLNITQEDEEQAKRLAILIQAGLAAAGVPTGLLTQKVITEVLKYALRDLKDGVEVHDKLILKRIVNEFQKEF